MFLDILFIIDLFCIGLIHIYFSNEVSFLMLNFRILSFNIDQFCYLALIYKINT